MAHGNRPRVNLCSVVGTMDRNIQWLTRKRGQIVFHIGCGSVLVQGHHLLVEI